MVALFYFSILVTASFLIYSVKKSKGIPESLSATYYTLGSEGWMFQMVTGVLGLVLLPVWVEVSEPEHQWMAFLSCSGLLFVSSAPSFRIPLQGLVHYSSAIICCVCAIFWQIASGLWDVLFWFAFLGLMLTLQMKDKYMWWLECAVIGSLFCNLIRLV